MRYRDNDDREAIPIPREWNETAIEGIIRRNRDRPNVMTYVVETLKERFFTGLDDKATQKRTAFLRTLIEHHQIQGEAYRLIRDLSRLPQEEAINDNDVEMRWRKSQSDLNSHSKTIQEQQERDRRVRERDRLQVDLEIAELQKKIKDLEGGGKSERKLTPEEERAKNRSYWQGEVDRLRKEKLEATSKASTDEERMRLTNMYDDAIERALEQLSRYL